MDLHNSKAYTRRAFIQHGVMLASAAVTVPSFLHGAATALAQAPSGLSSIPGTDEGRILVVIQLGGGNDGLNTVVPFGDGAYYNARRQIAVGERDVLRLGKGLAVGLHPQMGALKSLYDDGMLGIVQGVGYPNPNRSHFKSMDIWQTAETSGVGDGWLGRYFDNECGGEPLPNAGVAVGREAPLALQGRINKPIAFENADLFRWTGEDLHPSLKAPYNATARRGMVDGVPAGSNAGFLMRTALDAQLASDEIRKAVAMTPLAEYPRSRLGRDLAMIASMIRAGLKTRIYYAALGGFDTHAGQGGAQGRHANLLNQYADAIKAFYDDLKAQDNESRVLTMTFSEFGRRVAQNGSGGTDHGAAAPMFLAGPMARPGVIGKHPSLTDLDSGDLKYKIDFRSVYAAILKDWLGGDADAALGRHWRAAKILA